MIITLDGPAGTGKSTVALAVARRLGFDFLDTGAMYRAVALAAIRRGTALDDARELGFVADHCRIEFDWAKDPPAVLLSGEPVAHLLRGEAVTAAASKVAVVPAVRANLVRQQQEIGRLRKDLVSEGRDQGTVVFPQAQLKFYLDATPQERARRRVAQLRAGGEPADQHAIMAAIVERDRRDSKRAVGPLAVAHDAEILDTTGLTQEQVIDRIVSEARARRGV